MSQDDSTPVTYRDIIGFPGYRVGDDGSVWSCRTRKYGQIGTKWNRLYPTGMGHLRVRLFTGNGSVRKLVHHLVLEAFVGPRPDGAQCRHFPDRDPTNNRLENIQWGTAKENQNDRIAHGTKAIGEQHGYAILTDDIVRLIRADRAAGMTHAAIGRKYGVSRMVASQAARRLTWKHVN